MAKNEMATALGDILGDALEALRLSGDTKGKRTNWDKLDTPIEHSGRAIVLPAEPGKMPLEKAVEALNRRIKDENQAFNTFEIIDAYPHDGAVAFMKAVRELYGFASPETERTFFGPKPPTMMSIKTGWGLEDVMQCPLGQFRLPGVDEPVHATFHEQDGVPCFVIFGEVKKRDRHILLELATRTREIVKRESIYRGKAIRLRVDDAGALDMNIPPEFMNVRDTSESSILFDDALMSQINTSVLTPLKHTEICRLAKVPLKSTILAEGPYGTGKTLLARVAARVAEDNGWTFILLDNVSGLKTALEFANRYSPAVVFAEDIDRVASVRTDEMNDLVNTIDGVISKSSEIMTILTTNHVEKLHPVILRPGRIDAVLSIRAPGPKTVQRLLRYYAGPLIDPDEDLDEAGMELKEQIPASIRQCVERAKLGMISRGAETLSCDDLVTAARTMKNHLALLAKKEEELSAGDKLADALRDVMKVPDVTALNDTVEGLGDAVAGTHSNSLRIRRDVAEIKSKVVN